jgi:hypothetical protein
MFWRNGSSLDQESPCCKCKQGDEDVEQLGHGSVLSAIYR